MMNRYTAEKKQFRYTNKLEKRKRFFKTAVLRLSPAAAVVDKLGNVVRSSLVETVRRRADAVAACIS